jgi:hypothetical protein
MMDERRGLFGGPKERVTSRVARVVLGALCVALLVAAVVVAIVGCKYLLETGQC